MQKFCTIIAGNRHIFFESWEDEVSNIISISYMDDTIERILQFIVDG